MAFLEKSEGSIYYEFNGDPNAAVLTLVNGHTRTSSDFRAMSRFLNDRGLSTLAFDNRGAGKTTIKSPISLSGFCQDILDLWAEVGIKKSHLLGISMGGFIAQYLSAYYPERVASLILVSTTGDRRFIIDSGLEWQNDPHAIEEKLGLLFAPNYVANNKPLIKAMVSQIQKAIVEGDFLNRARAQREAVRSFPMEGLAERIQCPTLIVHGDEDRAVDVEAVRDLEKRIPKTKKIIYRGVGHLILAENPKVFYQEVFDFMNSLG